MYKIHRDVKQREKSLPRNFHLLLVSGSVSRVGTTAFSLSVLWITLALTGSALVAGLADGLFTFPLIFSFYFGALIDRSSRKKRVAVASILVRSAAVGLILVALFVHGYYLIIALVYSCVVITGMMSDIVNSVRSAWTKVFLNEKQYQRGSSVSSGLISLADGIGYASSGILLYYGYYDALLLIAAIFIISVIPVLFIREKVEIEKKIRTGSLKADIAESVRFIRKNRSVMQLIVLMIFANFIIAMVGIGFTFLVQKILFLPAYYLSVIFIALSAGMALGSIPGGYLKGTLGFVVAPLLAVVGIMFIAMVMTPIVFILVALVFGAGLAIGIINPVVTTVFIRKVPVEMMARISGTVNTLALSATFLSGTIAGTIIQFSSIFDLFVIIGSVIVVVGVATLFMREFSSERIESHENTN